MNIPNFGINEDKEKSEKLWNYHFGTFTRIGKCFVCSDKIYKETFKRAYFSTKPKVETISNMIPVCMDCFTNLGKIGVSEISFGFGKQKKVTFKPEENKTLVFSQNQSTETVMKDNPQKSNPFAIPHISTKNGFTPFAPFTPQIPQVPSFNFSESKAQDPVPMDLSDDSPPNSTLPNPFKDNFNNMFFPQKTKPKEFSLEPQIVNGLYKFGTSHRTNAVFGNPSFKF